MTAAFAHGSLRIELQWHARHGVDLWGYVAGSERPMAHLGRCDTREAARVEAVRMLEAGWCEACGVVGGCECEASR